MQTISPLGDVASFFISSNPLSAFVSSVEMAMFDVVQTFMVLSKL